MATHAQALNAEIPFAVLDGFAELPELGRVERVLLDSGTGMRAQLFALGATLMSLDVRTGSGARAPLVLGFDEPARYASAHPYFGSTIGRYANRIAGGRFDLDGESFALERNEERAHLHGGPRGFHAQHFHATPFADQDEAGVSFRLTSEHGAGGYPGRVDVHVRYALTRGHVLRIELAASTDRPTVLSLTHHGYFNLHDGGASDVLAHELEIPAQRVLEIDADGLPSGRVLDVAGTAFDFRSPQPIGARIGALRERGGYDHCYVLPEHDGRTLQRAATLIDPATQRSLEVWTTQPALQLYTGNFLDGSLTGHRGTRYAKHAGLCLEPQGFPDAPNHLAFPSARLTPEAPYRHTIEYRFGTADGKSA